MRARTRFVTLWLGFALGASLSSCARLDYVRPEPVVAHPARRAGDSPVRRAILWLESAQEEGRDDPRDPRTWSGGWPQWVLLSKGAPIGRIREVSPGIPAFVHHALTRVGPARAAAWGLERGDLERVHRMRRRATAFLSRFEVAHASLPSGLYGWWPATTPSTLLPPLPSLVVFPQLGGPRQHGLLAPSGVPGFPAALRVWPDIDDTALVGMALAAESKEGACGIEAEGRWLDDGSAPVLPRPGGEGPTGAFLTWLPDPTVAPRFLNDIDLAVNANVLLWLARCGEGDAPGCGAAVAWIRRVVDGCAALRELPAGSYYPSALSVAYAIARAAHEGPVEGLQPAAMRLARLTAEAGRTTGDGRMAWGRGGQVAIDTACAVLVMSHAGGHDAAVRAGARTLLDLQDDATGRWPPCTACLGRTHGGFLLRWRSPAFATALCMEALLEAGP